MPLLKRLKIGGGNLGEKLQTSRARFPPLLRTGIGCTRDWNENVEPKIWAGPVRAILEKSWSVYHRSARADLVEITRNEPAMRERAREHHNP